MDHSKESFHGDCRSSRWKLKSNQFCDEHF